MGCIHSTNQRSFFHRSNGSFSINDSNRNRVFDVVNVDDRGNEINFGKIEITENDLILHQRSKNPIVWPLRSLRRYGFDAQMFSFESGRRCSTGPGIYGFKCSQAEQLFNVLQDSLQRCSNQTTPNNHITSPTHGCSNGPSILDISARCQPSRLISPPHPYANDIRGYVNSPLYVNTLNGNGLFAGPLNGPFGCLNINGPSTGRSDINTNYAKFDDLVHYVNINTEDNIGDKEKREQETTQDNYKDGEENKPVNYIMLDLDNGANNGLTYVTTAPVTPIAKTFKSELFDSTPPSTPTSLKSNHVPDSYATIDFDKTVALSAANHRKKLMNARTRLKRM